MQLMPNDYKRSEDVVVVFGIACVVLCWQLCCRKQCQTITKEVKMLWLCLELLVVLFDVVSFFLLMKPLNIQCESVAKIN
jgi:ABC-type amino acid transport system permease subunit